MYKVLFSLCVALRSRTPSHPTPQSHTTHHTATDIDGNAEGEEEEGEGISSLSIDETFEGSEKGYVFKED